MLLALLLRAGAVGAEVPADAPLLQSVPGGYFVNEAGMARLNTQLAEWQQEKSRLQAENARLKADIMTAASRPALTWTSATLLVVAGAALGGAVTFLVLSAAGAQ